MAQQQENQGFSHQENHQEKCQGWPKGARVWAVRDDSLDGMLTLTLTVCTSISDQGTHPPVWAETTSGSNTATNWAHIIFDMLESGFLAKGDLLILDNAKVGHDRVHRD